MEALTNATTLSSFSECAERNKSSVALNTLNQGKKAGFWKRIYNGIFKNTSDHNQESSKKSTNNLVRKRTLKHLNSNNIFKSKKKLSGNLEDAEQDIAIAIKVPPGFVQEKTDIIIELGHDKEIINNEQQSNENLHNSAYFNCIEEKNNRAVFAGTIKVPPTIDLVKITSMPLFLFDTTQAIPTDLKTDFKYLSKIKPTKQIVSDKVNGKAMFGEISLKIIFQNKYPVLKNNRKKGNASSSKSLKDITLECSFIMNVPDVKLAESKNAQTTSQEESAENESFPTNSAREERVSVNNAINVSNIDPMPNNIGETCTDNFVSLNKNSFDSEAISTKIQSLVPSKVSQISIEHVPLNSPIQIIPTQSINEGAEETNSNIDQPQQLSTETEFGGVKKKHKNTTNGKNLKSSQEDTNNSTNIAEDSINNNEKSFDQKITGIQTIQNLYSSLNHSNSPENEERNPAYEDLLTKRYSPVPSEEARGLTYTVVENDVKNMIKDLLKESDDIKNEIILNTGYEAECATTDKEKMKAISNTLKEIINCVTDKTENENTTKIAHERKVNFELTDANYIEDVLDTIINNISTKEEDVKYIIDKILERVNDVDEKSKLFHKNVENSVHHIGDSSKSTTDTHKSNDVCNSQTIYYCNTNVFEHPRIPIDTKKSHPATVSIRKLSPSKKSIIKRDENLMKILEKSNGLLTNLYNELCSYDTVTYELDSTSSEHLYENNVTNKNHMFNVVLQNLSVHSTTAFQIYNNKSEDNEPSPSNQNTTKEQKTTTNESISRGSNMKKSSKFINIKGEKTPTPPRSENSISNEDLINTIDFNVETEKASTSKKINSSHKLPLSASHKSTVDEKRSRITTFKSTVLQTTEDENELEVNDQEVLCNLAYDYEMPAKPSLYSRASTRTRASNYIDSISSSDDSIIQNHPTRIKPNDCIIKQIHSCKSIKSSESEGLIEFPTLHPIVSNANLELQYKSGHPDIPSGSYYTEGSQRETFTKNINPISAITVDSDTVSDEEYPADREETILQLPKLEYTCVSTTELNTKSEINMIEKNLLENKLLEKHSDTDVEPEFTVIFTSDEGSASSTSESIISSVVSENNKN